MDEKLKNYTMFAVIGFNITVILLALIYWFIRGGLDFFQWYDFAVIIVLAGGVGAGVFFLCKQLDL